MVRVRGGIDKVVRAHKIVSLLEPMGD